jgi:trehalose utilization protein
MKSMLWLVFLVSTVFSALCREVLIVADEFPAMEVVAAKLKSDSGIASRIIKQSEMPTDLTKFESVIVYIHGALSEPAENAFIDYATSGGRLVLLHHSISSGKRKNAHWFSFLGVSLPEGSVTNGGYKWIEGVSFSLVNLNPHHFIMTNHVNWPEQIAWSTNSVGVRTNLPGFTLHETEVYLNHAHTEPRTLLMGLKFDDPTTHRTYMQSTAGWVKNAGKGWVVYLMPGHTKHDFETAQYGQIVANAITWRPSLPRP